MADEIKASPWDVFINLLAVIALYASIWSGLYAIFSLIDLALPDPLDFPIHLRDGIRSSLAIFIIFFPAYVWAWRTIEVDLASHPEKRARWLRTCPIYLTLFVTGLLALGDLSFVVYYFLTGDLALRVALKAGAVALVASAALAFYLYALRREPGPYPAGPCIFAYASFVVVAAVAIAGVAVAGSPRHARLQRLDAKRLQNLHTIQDEVLSYWKSKKKTNRINAALHHPQSPKEQDEFPASSRMTTVALIGFPPEL